MAIKSNVLYENSYALVICVAMETALSPEAKRMQRHQDTTNYVFQVT